MRRVLRKGFQNIEVLKWHESRPGESFKVFRDRFSALDFLRPFLRDSLSMINIRRILSASSLNGGATRLSDHQVLEQLAWRLTSGQFKILELPLEMPVWSPVEPEVEEEEAAPAAAVALETAWIKFEVVHDATGEPISGVKLKIKLPDGSEKDSPTGDDGTIELKGIDPGTCEVTSDIKGAKLEDSLAFVSMLTRSHRKDESDYDEEEPVTASQIALIEEHRVGTGETPENLAERAGMIWHELAEFNWGTSDPVEVNEYLKLEVGCTQKTPDGKNYIFDDSDDPGIIYIPKQWKKQALATDKTHTIRVKRIRPLLTIEDFIFSF